MQTGVRPNYVLQIDCPVGWDGFIIVALVWVFFQCCVATSDAACIWIIGDICHIEFREVSSKLMSDSRSTKSASFF